MGRSDQVLLAPEEIASAILEAQNMPENERHVGCTTLREVLIALGPGLDSMRLKHYTHDQMAAFVLSKIGPRLSMATVKSGLGMYFRTKRAAPRRRSRASASTSKGKRTSPPGQRSGDSAGSADGIARGTRTVTAPDIARQSPAASVAAFPPARKEAPGVPVTPPRAAPPSPADDDFDPFTDPAPRPKRSMYDRSGQGTSVGLTSRI